MNSNQEGGREWLLGRLEVEPLTAERWPAFEQFFSAQSPVKNCWCMWWRRTGDEFEKGRGAGNRKALQALAETGPPPGLVAYLDGEPIGWCSLGPREDYGRLQRSRALAPVDDQPVWSIVCFFVHPKHRSRGVAEAMLAAATVYAREHGASLLEAYPRDRGPHRQDDESVFTGPMPLYMRGAGFHEVARRNPERPILRLSLTDANAFESPADTGAGQPSEATPDG
ncbi:MAG: GNAT family N-acetyltransferase [Dehalococcoidia bacterium]